MQGLLSRLNQQKSQNNGSKTVSRSASIASSMDDPNDDYQQSSDESQSAANNTLKPKIRKEKKDDKKIGWGAKAAEPKKIGSRIDTGRISEAKLKLLDATRKAIMDKSKKQLVSSYAQTDASKTKLCKDQSVDSQYDLQRKVNQGTETDVEMVAMRAKDGSLIITSTVGMITDTIPVETVATQTNMPRSSVSFKRFLGSKHSIQYTMDEEDLSNEEDTDDASKELLSIESRMKAKKKFTRQRPLPKSKIDIVVEDEAADEAAAEKTTAAKAKKSKEGSDSEFEDSIQDDLQPDVIKGSVKRSKQSDSTFNSWHDLDFPEEKVELPRSYFTDGPTPWANFQDLVLGQRFLNARLSPSGLRQQQRQNMNTNMKQVTWSDSQVQIVTDLIREANALNDMFDQVAMLLGPDIKLHNVSDVEDFVLPPSKYGHALTKKCDKLEASLKRLQDIKDPIEN